MSTKGTADIVFCLDRSDSMRPCIDAVRRHLVDFISSLQDNSQGTWDLRFDFVAFNGSDAANGFVVDYQSLNYSNGMDLINAVYGGQSSGNKFFTSDHRELATGLANVNVEGDEASLFALDMCLDFPWRVSSNCHRVIIMLTDEPFETGFAVTEQSPFVEQLIDKIQKLRVILFLVAPASATYEKLSCAQRSEYEEVNSANDGLSSIDFKEVIMAIGKSISVSNLQSYGNEAVQRDLFGQSDWLESDAEITGR